MDDDYKIAELDLEKVKQKIAKLPKSHSDIVEQQKLPAIEQRNDIVQLIKYNGLVLILDYGEYLLSLIHPWLGKSFGWSIKKLFNWRSKGL